MSLDTSVASAPSPRPVATRRGLLAGILGTAAGHRFAPAMAAAQSWGTPLRTAAPGVAQGGEASSGTRPNIVLILLDDLDAEGVAHMPSVRALLEERGTSFANFFVTTPVCGPARASLLRGQYAHNHGMQANTGANGGFSTFHRLGRQASTVAVWLEAAGYRTAYFGKYLNGFPKGVGARDVPPGWVEWFGLASKQPSYFDYELNENGRLVAYGQDVEDYSTDVLAGKASDFVRRTLATGNPFFACVAPLAPHWPAVPAPGMPSGLSTSRRPGRPPSTRPTPVTSPSGSAKHRNSATIRSSRSTRSTASGSAPSKLVDEMVATLVETLEIGGGLENTVLLVTLDNGSFAGEHRLAAGKQAPYEEAIRVPLLVRGPGIAAKHSVAALALNVDLAPTIADLAGVTPPDFVDGRSLVPQLRGEQPAAWR
jgi:arylsulfatase A-like enzyme